MRAILLAAGRGKRFGRRTALLPKCLIPLKGTQTLLKRYLDTFRVLGIHDVVLVVGHQQAKIRKACARWARRLPIRFIENPEYRHGSIVSLWQARKMLDTDCLIMDADVFFGSNSLKPLLAAKRSAFLMDPSSKSSGEEMMLMARGRRIVKIAKKVDPSLRIKGEATGFLKLVQKDAKALAVILDRMVRSGIKDAEYEDAYNAWFRQGRPKLVPIKGYWTEMDFEEDLRRIRQTLKT